MHKPAPLLLVTLCLLTGMLHPSPAHALPVRARQAGVYNPGTGEWLYEKSPDQPVPVASLTKLAAALTFVRLTDDLDQLITIQRPDWVRSGKTRLRIGDRVPARTLLQLALVASDNCAARALTHPFGLSGEAYGYLMQETARMLGCRQSVFVEPTGLDPRNVATVRDVVLLFSEALRHPDLAEILGTSRFTLETPRGPRSIVHSSRMLRYRREVVAAKTGYISQAGYCLAQYVRDEEGDYITVILGARSKRGRNQESLRLMDYIRRQRNRPS